MTLLEARLLYIRKKNSTTWEGAFYFRQRVIHVLGVSFEEVLTKIQSGIQLQNMMDAEF